MIPFNPNEPIVRSKQQHLDVQDLKGLWKIHWQIGDLKLYSGSYTRIDQVFLLWGWMTLIIFAIAQFFPISWITQACYTSVLTTVGALGMVALTYCWSRIEQVTWIVYWWVLLLSIGSILTNFGIFWGWGVVLINLSPIWLAFSALGYLGTGIGLGSRAFIMAGLIHLLTIILLPHVAVWQFLVTGIVMGGTLLVFAEIQWDMRPPMESTLLTAEQVVFNREQQYLRQRN